MSCLPLLSLTHKKKKKKKKRQGYDTVTLTASRVSGAGSNQTPCKCRALDTVLCMYVTSSAIHMKRRYCGNGISTEMKHGFFRQCFSVSPHPFVSFHRCFSSLASCSFQYLTHGYILNFEPLFQLVLGSYRHLCTHDDSVSGSTKTYNRCVITR